MLHNISNNFMIKIICELLKNNLAVYVIYLTLMHLFREFVFRNTKVDNF